MIIIQTKDTYIRPHKHLNKTESFHVVDGCATMIIFNEEGNILNHYDIGNIDSEMCFFFRLSLPLYHTLLIHSDYFIFHETTSGPFDPNQTIYAPWSPEENKFKDRIYYKNELIKKIGLK
jgi:cupin fold WbuC family metalloprotein